MLCLSVDIGLMLAVSNIFLFSLLQSIVFFSVIIILFQKKYYFFFFHSCFPYVICTFYRCPMVLEYFLFIFTVFCLFLILEALYHIRTLRGAFLKASGVPLEILLFQLKFALLLVLHFNYFSAFPPVFLCYPSVAPCCILFPLKPT